MSGRLGLRLLVLVTALLLETVLLPGLAVQGVVPAVVLLTVVGFGLAEGSESGSRYGFVAGFVVDLLSGGLIGLSALVFLLAGFCAGLSRPYLSTSVLVGQVVVGGAASAGATLLYGLLSLLLEPGGPTLPGVVTAAIITGFYSAAVGPFVLRPVAALSKRVEVAAAASAR